MQEICEQVKVLIHEKIELKAKLKSKEIDFTIKTKEYEDAKAKISERKPEILQLRSKRRSRLQTV